MIIQLSIDYRTNWGEVVCAEFTINRKKGGSVKRELLLETTNGILWSGELNLIDKDALSFSYYFNIKALKYTEKEEEAMAIKNGLLYLLFGKYSDLFLKLSVISGLINIGVNFF